MPLYRTLLHSIDNHGLGGTLARIAARLAGDRPAGAAGAAGAPVVQPHPFDVQHGTETGGWIPGERLTSGSRSLLYNPDLYNTAYYGISPSTLRHALELIGPLPPGVTFVDLGCGKGRALLVASEFPFGRLLGVDLSGELCGIARANAAKMALPQVTILQHDAATLALPNGPLVVFLYHPFLQPVLRRVFASLGRQREHAPHPTWLLYANPQYPRLFARATFLQPVWDYNLKLSEEDQRADRFGTMNERYALYRIHRQLTPEN